MSTNALAETSGVTVALLDQVMGLAMRVNRTLRGVLDELDINEPLANLLLLFDPAADPVPMRKLAG